VSGHTFGALHGLDLRNCAEGILLRKYCIAITQALPAKTANL